MSEQNIASISDEERAHRLALQQQVVYAATRDDLKLVRKLLDDKVDIRSDYGKVGRAPIYSSVLEAVVSQSGAYGVSTEVVRAICDAKPKPNFTGSLIGAVGAKNFHFLPLLIKAKADIYEKDIIGTTLFELAKLHGALDILKQALHDAGIKCYLESQYQPVSLPAQASRKPLMDQKLHGLMLQYAGARVKPGQQGFWGRTKTSESKNTDQSSSATASATANVKPRQEESLRDRCIIS